MARREQTGTGGARRRPSSGATAGRARKPRKGRTPRARRRAVSHAQRSKPTGQMATPAAAHSTEVSAWRSVTGAASLSPLRALTTAHALPEVALTLVGAEQTTLGAALHAWDAARDLAANRAWRRPGGLTRMAGL